MVILVDPFVPSSSAPVMEIPRRLEVFLRRMKGVNFGVSLTTDTCLSLCVNYTQKETTETVCDPGESRGVGFEGVE